MGIDFSPMKNDLTHKKKCRPVLCRWVALTQNDVNCVLGKVVATMIFLVFYKTCLHRFRCAAKRYSLDLS